MNFDAYLNNFGIQSFRQTISEVNDIPRKDPRIAADDLQDPQLSVLQYLQRKGVKVGRMPKQPVVDSS
uniref:ATP-dependent RNA helicase n=1 Tax=Caenorhabditis tropicalis TaxID=1561998 RepID=A0A1I7U3N1_9PELO